MRIQNHNNNKTKKKNQYWKNISNYGKFKNYFLLFLSMVK